MSTSKLVFVVTGLFACVACTKKQAVSPSRQVPHQLVSAPGSSSSTRSDAAAAETLDAGPAMSAGAHSPLKPLADGKRVRITKLWVAPVEITVPPDFRLRMEGGEELAPTAYLEGPDLKVSVNEPEAGFSTLEGQKMGFKNSYPDATTIRSEETPEGYLLVDRVTFAGQLRYSAYVARPKLKVHCSAGDLDTLQQAELAASICLTLRPAPRGTSHR
jgi:hypothetical protein